MATRSAHMQAAVLPSAQMETMPPVYAAPWRFVTIQFFERAVSFAFNMAAEWQRQLRRLRPLERARNDSSNLSRPSNTNTETKPCKLKKFRCGADELYC